VRDLLAEVRGEPAPPLWTPSARSGAATPMRAATREGGSAGPETPHPEPEEPR